MNEQPDSIPGAPEASVEASAQAVLSPDGGLSRRTFFKISLAGGVGLTVAIYLSGCGGSPEPLPTLIPTSLPSATLEPTSAETPEPTATETPEPTATPEPVAAWEPNLYLIIDPAGTVTVRAFRTEMGQGIRTAIAMILAEELDADWSSVRIEQSPVDRAYGDQVTGGSVSVSRYYTDLRRAGAAARDVLLSAAATTWGVKKDACRTESGWALHPDGQQRLAYGELVEMAVDLPVPSPRDVPLKDPADFSIIGTSRTLYDAPAVVTGSALFASDLRLPGMLYAAVAHCPAVAGKVTAFDDAPARAVAGVRDVIQIPSGIAVVAENTWAALQGRAALQVTWDESSVATLSSAGIRQGITSSAVTSGGDEPNAMGAGYNIPYLAHATMEPMVCVADVRDGHCEVWAPSQDPQAAKLQAMSASRLNASDVVVHVPLVGGAFGRRHVADFVIEAVQISQAASAPIKLFWSRDDDLQHDYYHPLSYSYISATLDAAGRLSSLPSPMRYQGRGVPTGYWRSVEQFPTAFARECFLDEIAAAAGLDPVDLRLGLVPARGKAVVELAATKAGWGTSLPAGSGRGIGYFACFGVTHVAHVVELTVGSEGQIHVDHVVCAVDCGLVVNPDTVAAQMEGGIVFGLTAALKPGITVENGRVQQSNFHDHPLLRLDEMPVVEVHIVPSDASPSGVGEMAVPPIAPAVANAVFAASGKRVRHIPILPQDLA